MPLQVDIVAPEGVLWMGEAEHISLLTVEGSIGLYPAHEPILSVLQACSIGVVVADGSRIEVPIGGGFVSFDDDRVTVIANPARESAKTPPAQPGR